MFAPCHFGNWEYLEHSNTYPIREAKRQRGGTSEGIQHVILYFHKRIIKPYLIHAKVWLDNIDNKIMAEAIFSF